MMTSSLYYGFQSALVLTLVVTLAINILFILDTSKKLHDENPKSPGEYIYSLSLHSDKILEMKQG